MKLSELKQYETYAVVPSWGYNSSSARDIDKVRENDVVKAQLLSLEKYEYQPSNRYADMSKFALAKQGDRSVGVLMKATANGQDFYWTARLADIVSEYAKLEPIWQAKLQTEAEAERIEKEKRAVAQAVRDKAEAYVNRSKAVVSASIAELVGNRVSRVEVQTTGYGENTQAVAIISLHDLETLIELAYEGKAQVA